MNGVEAWVPIAIGAIVAATGTIAASLITAAKSWEKEKRLFKLKLIDELTVEFSKAHDQILRFFMAYAEIWDAALNQNNREDIGQLYTTAIKMNKTEVIGALLRITICAHRFYMLGGQNAAMAFNKYAEAVESARQTLHDPDHIQSDFATERARWIAAIAKPRLLHAEATMVLRTYFEQI